MTTKPEIVVNCIYPPIPIRQFDWFAYYDGSEPDDNGNMPHGYGRTADEARADLVENYPK